MNLYFFVFLIICGLLIYFSKNKRNRLTAILQNVSKKLNFQHQSIKIEENGVNIQISNYSELNNTESANHMCYYDFINCNTMFDILPRGVKKTIDQKCLGIIQQNGAINWINYETVEQRTKLFGCGLLQLDLAPKSTVGIYAKNCAEYTISEYACYRHAMIVVPIYDTANFDSCIYISNHVKLTTIICDSLLQIKNILKNYTKFETLKHIIMIQNNSDNFKEFEFIKLSKKGKIYGMKLFLHKDIEKLGKLYPKEDHPPTRDDIALILCTSGSTGFPKGAMLSHQNVVANFKALIFNLFEYTINESDILISYLPLGHIFGRIGEACLLAVGGKIVYFRGNIQNLSKDIQIAKPTILPCVPRVLNKIYDRIFENVQNSVFKSWLLKTAYDCKRKQLSNQRYYTECIWDLLVFSKIRNQLGGNVRVIPVTSAPMDAKVLDFLRCAIGCPILLGYGLTECAGACTLSLLGDFSLGHVGVPLPTCSIKLIDVPEMNYYAINGMGEVLLRGPIVFKGYYLDKDKTDKAIDSHGWLHTGDIGQWNENGTLKIIDRKSNIFKLSQGEFIAPEKIEQIYSRSQYIQQIFVYGDSLKSFLVAIVVPKVELILNVKFENVVSLKSLILNDLKMIGKIEKLSSLEQVKDIYVHNHEFSIENGLLTPTLKNKRYVLKKVFNNQIKDLYNQKLNFKVC